MARFDPEDPEQVKADALEAEDLPRAVAAVERYRSGKGGSSMELGEFMRLHGLPGAGRETV